MNTVALFVCLFLLSTWLRHRGAERKQRILGCTHERLEVCQTRPEYGATLYFQCPEKRGGCGYQAHLLGFRPLPMGVFLPMVYGDKADEAEYMRLFYEMCEVKARREPEPLP